MQVTGPDRGPSSRRALESGQPQERRAPHEVVRDRRLGDGSPCRAVAQDDRALDLGPDRCVTGEELVGRQEEGGLSEGDRASSGHALLQRTHASRDLLQDLEPLRHREARLVRAAVHALGLVGVAVAAGPVAMGQLLGEPLNERLQRAVLGIPLQHEVQRLRPDDFSSRLDPQLLELKVPSHLARVMDRELGEEGPRLADGLQRMELEHDRARRSRALPNRHLTQAEDAKEAEERCTPHLPTIGHPSRHRTHLRHALPTGPRTGPYRPFWARSCQHPPTGIQSPRDPVAPDR
jgi:hypothetical protein